MTRQNPDRLGPALGTAERKLDALARSVLGFLLAAKTYGAFCALLLVYGLTGLVFLDAGGHVDYWDHLAAIRALREDPLHPANPYFATDDPTHLFTPYHFVWGLVASATGVDPFDLLPLAGTLNLALFLVACRIAARYLVGDARYALATALALLFLWRYPWSWSGFHDFGLLPLTAVYPFWFALSLALIVVALHGEQGYRGPGWTAVAVAAVALVFLVHPITGGFLCVGLVLKAALVENLERARRAVLALTAAAGLALALAWPLFPVWEALTRSDEFESLGLSGTYSEFYDHALVRIGPALPGLVYIGIVALRRRVDFIAGALAAFGLIYLVNYVWWHSAPVARFIAFIALTLQFAVVAALRVFAATRLRAAALAAFVLLIAGGLMTEARQSARWLGWLEDARAGTSLGEHSNRDLIRDYGQFRSAVRFDDVVLANVERSFILPGALGCKVVASLNSNPFLRDWRRRLSDLETFFDSRASVAIRQRIMERYRVHFVLLESDELELARGLPLDLVATNDDTSLYRARREAG